MTQAAPWRDHFRHLAHYNQWANRTLYAAAAELPAADYFADRHGFFGSIHGTLNHLLMGDKMWFGRIRPPAFTPTGYRQIFADDLAGLQAVRTAEDARIVALVDDLTEAEILQPLSWRTMAGDAQTLRLDRVLTHVFNHHTHHRGQAHDQLSQALVGTGREPPPLDFYQVMFDPAFTGGH